MRWNADIELHFGAGQKSKGSRRQDVVTCTCLPRLHSYSGCKDRYVKLISWCQS